jgi:hypothetical protein
MRMRPGRLERANRQGPKSQRGNRARHAVDLAPSAEGSPISEVRDVWTY